MASLSTAAVVVAAAAAAAVAAAVLGAEHGFGSEDQAPLVAAVAAADSEKR